MTTAAELAELFDVQAGSPRIGGFGGQTGIARQPQAESVAVTAELLHPKDKKPSGKTLWLQLQPVDALILSASILAVARDAGWQIPKNLIEKVETVRMPSKSDKKH